MAVLTPPPAWAYFGADQTAGLAALRTALGSAWASAPTDAVLLDALTRAVSVLHDVTGMFFVLRTGTLTMDGNGLPRLPITIPIVGTEQGGDGITEITINGEAVDELATGIAVNAGVGFGSDDPRWDPYVEWIRSSASYWTTDLGRFTTGVRNVTLTGDFGFVEADGSTPYPIKRCILLMIAQTTSPTDTGSYTASECDDLGGGLISEVTRDRSYTYSERAIAYGVTLNREADMILRRYSARATLRAHFTRADQRRDYR